MRPNLVADTTANNAGVGDDVQLVPVGAACTANQVVVDSGADGIATTRAEGADLRISASNCATHRPALSPASTRKKAQSGERGRISLVRLTSRV